MQRVDIYSAHISAKWKRELMLEAVKRPDFIDDPREVFDALLGCRLYLKGDGLLYKGFKKSYM